MDLLTIAYLIGGLVLLVLGAEALVRGAAKLAARFGISPLMLVLGAGALVSADGLSISPNALAFDLPVMLAVFAACLPIFFSGYRINRWEGVVFFGYYLAYTLYLVLFSTGLPAINLLRHAMTWYVLPLTAITLLVIFLRAWKHQR